MRLTAQELEQMKSVDIGAVSPESLPDVSGMTFDNALSRKERVTRFFASCQKSVLLQHRRSRCEKLNLRKAGRLCRTP